MRPIGSLFVVAAAGLLGLKLFGGLLPLLAMLFGLFAFALKLGVIVAIGYFVLSLLRNRRRRHDLD